MHIKKIGQEKLSEMEFPPVVYKYRTWKEDFHKSIITKREVYMASPKDFEDPVDCKIPVRWDLLSKNELYNKYLRFSMDNNPERSYKEHRKHAQRWNAKTPINDPAHLEEQTKESFDELCENLGVLSLTTNPFRSEMWDKYADNSKGICVGFDPKLMFPHLGGGGNVLYYDELPIIYPTPKHSLEEHITLQVYSKLKKWEFEEEYRTQKYSPDGFTRKSRVIELPPEAYKEIIIGEMMPKTLRDDFLASIPPELSHVLIKDMSVV
jgi:hypothetical protein